MAYFKSRFYCVAAVLLAIGAGPCAAEIVPDNGSLNFRVMRSGEQIGTHKLSFRQSDDVIDVKINTRIAVKMAFITVYRFTHDAHEVWKNGMLTNMETQTHDDGTDHNLRVLPTVSMRRGRTLQTPTRSLPTRIWRALFTG